MSYTQRDMEVVVDVLGNQREMTASLMQQQLDWITKDRDEWMKRALDAEEHLAAIHARFFDLLERPAGL